MSTLVPSFDTGVIVADPLRFRDAFHAVVEELEVIDAKNLLAITLDIPTAVTAVLGRAPQLRAFREAVVVHLPRANVDDFNRVETFAMALGHAHTLYVSAPKAGLSIPELATELTQRRKLILSDIQALVARGLLDGTKLDSLLGPSSYKNVAFDVMMLGRMMRNDWSNIENSTAMEISGLDRNEVLAHQLIFALGRREQKSSEKESARDMRVRAYTQLVRTYAEVRRAVSYLRWYEGDVDQIAPSLFNKRSVVNRRSRK